MLFLASHFAFATVAPITETEKNFTTIKLWGFLKYYHPQVAKGKFDWDKQLFDILDKTKAAQDKASLSEMYGDWIDGLGPVPTCSACAKPSKNIHFDKNFDLGWTQDQNLFTAALSAKLKQIEENRHQGKSHYAGAHRQVGNVEFRNENDYKGHDWQDMNIRLLALARYWNQVEYFSPYKYMTDQKWDDVLMEMIPKFIHAASDQQYRLAMLELVVKLDDSHANLITIKTNEYFGYYWIPAKFKIIDEKAVVTGFYDDSLAAANDLRIGDVIEKVNGETVADIVKRQWHLINGSNHPTKLRNTYYCITNGQTDKVNLSINRNGTTAEKMVNRYRRDSFKPTIAASKKPWKIMAGDIGYVDMGNLEFDIKNVDRMMDSLKTTKTIIFDIRNYPKGTMYLIARHLSRPDAPFVHFTEPDLDYPGKFVWRKEFFNGMRAEKNLYAGKIILLVDESTQSHAEFTAMLFQTAKNVTTVGSQTAGADGNVSEVLFPGNHKSYLTGLGVFYPDGTETQRRGIRVDLEVKPTIAGVREGRDEVLEKALKLAAQ